MKMRRPQRVHYTGEVSKKKSRFRHLERAFVRDGGRQGARATLCSRQDNGTAPLVRAHPFWAELFGNPAPVELEIGSGDGTFLRAAALRDPDVNLLGIENAYPRLRRAEERVAAMGSPRVRTLMADATCVIKTIVPAASVHAYHIYFPDPWPKHRHAKRRVVTPSLVRALARTLIPGGHLFLATDVHGYGWLMRGCILAHPAFVELPVDDTHGGLLTGFARKYRARGRQVFLATFQRIEGR